MRTRINKTTKQSKNKNILQTTKNFITMNREDIMHRFANKQFGKNGTLVAGNVHCDTQNYYSYNTIFAQWVDTDVCLVYAGDTSISSNRHKLDKSYFPDNITILPYDDGGCGHYYHSYHGCKLLRWNGDKFDFEHRSVLIDYYVGRLFDKFLKISQSNRKGFNEFSLDEWQYCMTLCAKYRDTTINKWLRIKGRISDEWRKRKQMVRLLDGGCTDIPTITDALFGEGTYADYMKRTKRFRKTEETKNRVIALCNRLGIASPYSASYCQWGLLDSGLSVDAIRKLTAKQRLDLHFKALEYRDMFNKRKEINDKHNRRVASAFRWVTGYPATTTGWGSVRSFRVDKCLNMFTKDEYDLSIRYGLPYRLLGIKFTETSICFDYDDFAHAANKREWLEQFYAACADAHNVLKARDIMSRERANTDENGVWVADEYLRSVTNGSEFALCQDYIERMNAYLRELSIRERAERIAREERMIEDAAEDNFQSGVSDEQIRELFARGIEGCRDAWRGHYCSFIRAERAVSDDAKESFCFGGNVLLRLSMNRNKVETSKGIRISVANAKNLFAVIKEWHYAPEKFQPLKVQTLFGGTYTITDFSNDVLTAGCHKIAYCEMERMYNVIIVNENAK